MRFADGQLVRVVDPDVEFAILCRIVGFDTPHDKWKVRLVNDNDKYKLMNSYPHLEEDDLSESMVYVVDYILEAVSEIEELLIELERSDNVNFI